MDNKKHIRRGIGFVSTHGHAENKITSVGTLSYAYENIAVGPPDESVHCFERYARKICRKTGRLL